MRTETVRVVTADGVTLAADVAVPPQRPVGAAVVCHPHPSYGGDRHNAVVEVLWQALAGAGWMALRFDFRGAGGSGGTHSGGRAERLDVLAAIDAAALATDAVPASPAVGGPVPVPVLVAGYSFGALVALDVDHPRVSGWLAVAPPLGPGARPAAADDVRPARLLVPAHDQFCQPDTARATTRTWLATEVVEVPMADHFLAGAHRFLATDTTTFAVSLFTPPT